MKKLLGELYLRLGGWRRVGEQPPDYKCVLIAAPHTSNWDLPAMLAFAWAYEFRPRWMGKRELFSGPWGPLMRWLGGIPIDRRSPHGVVAQLAQVFAEQERLWLVVPPEGTRSYRDHWKSGFYHIAAEAEVPIVLTVLDWGRKEGGFGPTVRPSGDLPRDMDQIRAFYAGREGKRPAQVSQIRLREEAPRPTDDPRTAAPGACGSST